METAGTLLFVAATLGFLVGFVWFVVWTVLAMVKRRLNLRLLFTWSRETTPIAVTMIVSALVGVVGLALEEASSPAPEEAPPAATALPAALPAPTPTFEQQREKVVLFLRQLNQVGNSFEDSLEAANFGGRLASGDPAQVGAAVATYLELLDGVLRRVRELAPPPEVPDLVELRSAVLSVSQKARQGYEKAVQSAVQAGSTTGFLPAFLQQLEQLGADPDVERLTKRIETLEESLLARFNIPDREVDYRRPSTASADAPTSAAPPTPVPTPRGTPLPSVLASSTPVTKDQRQDLQDTRNAFVSFTNAVIDGRLESGSGLSVGFTRGDRKTIIDVFPSVGLETGPVVKAGVTPIFQQVGNATIRGIKGNLFYVLKKSPAGSSLRGSSDLKRLGLGSSYPVVEALNQGNALVALEPSHRRKGQATLKGDQVPVYPAMENLAQGDAGIVFETSEPPGGRVIIQGDRVTLLGKNGSILGQFGYEGHNVEQEIQEVLDWDVAPPDEQAIARACREGASSTSNARVFVASIDRVESGISRGQETSSQAIHQLAAQQVREYDCKNKEHRHRFALDIQGDTSGKVDFQGLVYVQNPPSRAPTAQVTLTLYVFDGSLAGPGLAGVQVTGKDGAGRSFSLATNTDGYVAVLGVPGTWEFTATKSGYQPNSWSQSITATGRREAFLTRTPVTLTLYVFEGSTSGPPLPGALVTGLDGGGQSFSQTTNSSGYVAVSGIPGLWEFTATKSGYQSNSWSQSITATGRRDAFLTPTPTPTPTPTSTPGPETWTGSANATGETFGRDVCAGAKVSFNLTLTINSPVPLLSALRGNQEIYFSGAGLQSIGATSGSIKATLTVIAQPPSYPNATCTIYGGSLDEEAKFSATHDSANNSSMLFYVYDRSKNQINSNPRIGTSRIQFKGIQGDSTLEDPIRIGFPSRWSITSITESRISGVPEGSFVTEYKGTGTLMLNKQSGR